MRRLSECGAPVGAPRIVLPAAVYQTVLRHAGRKLDGDYLAGEVPEQKAFGLLAGRTRPDGGAELEAVFPLIANRRFHADNKADFDELVDRYSIPSDTPTERRGWVADPREVLAAEDACDDNGWTLLGNYHTHRVPWPHDPYRDSCTRLDRELAEGTGQWVFIVSVVDRAAFRLRAFFEGDNEREAALLIAAPMAKPVIERRAA